MIFLKDVNYLCISVVIPAVPAPQQQGAVAPKCSRDSQLGPVNTYFKSHFLGIGTRKFKTSGVRPRPKTYAYVTVRRTGHGQLCNVINNNSHDNSPNNDKASARSDGNLT